MGSIEFIDLRDRSGIVQVLNEDSSLSISKESVIKVTGKVVERKDKNKNLETGDIEIISEKIEMLAKSEVPPFVIDDKLIRLSNVQLARLNQFFRQWE